MCSKIILHVKITYNVTYPQELHQQHARAFIPGTGHANSAQGAWGNNGVYLVTNSSLDGLQSSIWLVFGEQIVRLKFSFQDYFLVLDLSKWLAYPRPWVIINSYFSRGSFWITTTLSQEKRREKAPFKAIHKALSFCIFSHS